MTSEKINILIVEDEAIVAMDLAAGLQKDGYHISGIADNATDATVLFRENEADIILMDIHIIGDKDGIDTTLSLLQIKQVPVIYLSAFSDAATVNRVKDIHPAAFLSKPYSINNVRIAIELAISNFAVAHQQQSATKIIPMKDAVKYPLTTFPDKEPVLQMNDFIFIKHNYQFIKIRLNDLLYMEADNNYISIVTAEKKFAVRLSLNIFLEKVSFSKLIRIHRSYAVNIDCIKSFNEQAVMVDRFELPIGRNYKEDFLKQFHFG